MYNNHIAKILILISVNCWLGCSASNPIIRKSELLPVAPSRITILDENGEDTSEPLVYKGAFAKLVVTPRIDPNEPNGYWKPCNLRAAICELEHLVPANFYERLLAYYGLSNRPDAKPIRKNYYVDDPDYEERVHDLNNYIIDIWDLYSDSNLGKQFDCISIFEGGLYSFYNMVIGYEAEKRKMYLPKKKIDYYRRKKIKCMR